MNIDLMHYASPPIVGGVESVLGHHARLLVNHGHNVRILAGRGDQIDPRIRFIKLPLIDSRHEEILRVKSFLDKGEIPDDFTKISDAIYSKLFKTIKNTDVLIAHNICSLSKNLPLTRAVHRLTSEISDLKFILWHHDLAWTTPRYLPELHEGYPWNLLREKWEGVINVVVSRERRRELAKLYAIEPGEIQVIPNGLDLESFLNIDVETMKYVNKMGLLDAEPLLLLPVRITPRKNIEFAIDVIKSICNYYPMTRLLITGPLGPHNPANLKYFETLIDRREELNINKSVFFLAEYSEEYIPDKVISDLYRLSDALFLPSKEEGFGIPILEAGITGMPIFCSDIPPFKELGDRYANFFSISSSPEYVAKMIIQWLSKDAGYSMRVHVRQNYNWEQIYQNKIAPLIGD